MLINKGGYDATIWAARPRHSLVQVTPPGISTRISLPPSLAQLLVYSYSFPGNFANFPSFPGYPSNFPGIHNSQFSQLSQENKSPSSPSFPWISRVPMSPSFPGISQEFLQTFSKQMNPSFSQEFCSFPWLLN